MKIFALIALMIGSNTFAFNMTGAGTYTCTVSCKGKPNLSADQTTTTFYGLSAVGCASKGEDFCSDKGGLAAGYPKTTPSVIAGSAKVGQTLIGH